MDDNLMTFHLKENMLCLKKKLSRIDNVNRQRPNQAAEFGMGRNNNKKLKPKQNNK